MTVISNDSLTIKEVKEFIEKAESLIQDKEGEDKHRQVSFVRGLKIMFSMMDDVIR